jgi:hypothetical protein
VGGGAAIFVDVVRFARRGLVDQFTFGGKALDTCAGGSPRAAHMWRARRGDFFEKFMGPEDHWLPPDNFQENPRPVLATRTSPTNIGMALLSTLGAYDFGYLSLDDLTDRVRQTLSTLEQMERYQGHFYNWYDTRTLKPLGPLYVSTVDNGNLASLLLTLHSGLVELATQEWSAARPLPVCKTRFVCSANKLAILRHCRLWTKWRSNSLKRAERRDS